MKSKYKNFCDISYFMKHGCRGCVRERECESYNNNLKKKEGGTGAKKEVQTLSRKTKKV